MPILESIVGSKIYGFGSFDVPPAFESIASTTLVSNSSSVVFSSIPSTYASLQIRGFARSPITTSNLTLMLRLNGSSQAFYAWHETYANGSGTVAQGAPDDTSSNIGHISGAELGTSVWGSFIIDIDNYASSSKLKSFRSVYGYDVNSVGQGRTGLNSGIFRQTSTINSVTVMLSGSNTMATGSTISLYGIKGA